MKQVIIQKIKLENFLSFGNDPIEITIENGNIIFITGINKYQKKGNNFEDYKNGVGKTALIIESLSFALFGETYRGINQAEVVNNITNSNCVVQLWFKVNDDQFHIIRSLKPNSLVFNKNGEQLNITRTIPETNKDIIRLLGHTKEIFTNIIVMSNNASEMVPFLKQKKAAKISFIEGILGLEPFSKMFDDAKQSFLNTSKETDKLEIKIGELNKTITSDKIYEKQENEKHKKNVSEIEKTIKDLEKANTKFDSDQFLNLQNSYTELKSTISQQEEKIQKAKVIRVGLESDIKNEKYNLSKFKDVNICPTCKRPFEDHNSDELIKEENLLIAKVTELEQKYNNLKSAIMKSEVANIKRKQELKIIEDNYEKLETEKEKCDKSEERICVLGTQLEQVKNYINPFSEKITKENEQLDVLGNSFSIYQRKCKIEEVKKFVCSPTGLKSGIVKKIINTFNNKLNYYLTHLECPCTCVFNEFFEETLYNLRGKDISYETLSGGESKRLDLALLFAFRDLRRLQSNVTINISVFDEIFDGALDKSAIQSIMKLLKDMTSKNNETYFIITHLDSMDAEGCKVINLVKEKDGITRLEN